MKSYASCGFSKLINDAKLFYLSTVVNCNTFNQTELSNEMKKFVYLAGSRISVSFTIICCMLTLN
jgi:hypothetical protein